MKPPPSRPGARAAVALLAAALLAGCATVDPDAGLAPVAETVRERLGAELRADRSESDRSAIDARVAELLGQPLTADAAVQVALLAHRGLQARLADLGITAAEVVQAGRLPNPGFAFGRTRAGDERETERGLHLNLARLLALPMVRDLEQRRFEQLQRELTMDLLAAAADVRRAWVEAVAAEQMLRYRRQVRDAAEAGAELARRMEQVGNFNRLMRAREQGFHAEAALGLAQAEQAARASRERLVRKLGLWGAQTAFTLPERLPDLPAEPLDAPDIERQGMAQRLDVQAARLAAEQAARNLGLTRTTRFVDVLELGLARNSSSDGPTERGWELEFELPLFDWGDAKVARAESVHLRTLHRAAQTAIDARSELREAYGAYRTAWDLARHQRDEILPLAQRISEEQLLRYNGMFIGVFDLLADARAQIAAVVATIDALRSFWLAQADLDMALVGKPALIPVAAPAGPAAAAAPDPH